MVGDILRKERERQKLTLADIERGTSIRSLYIDHIEQGNLKGLPGMVYAKGFVRNYAAFLHLDAEQMVQQFVAEHDSTPAQVPAPAPAPEPEAVPEEEPRRISLSDLDDASLSSISIGDDKSSYMGIFGKLAVGFIVLIAVVGGSVALLSYINAPAKEPPEVSQQAPAQAPAPAAHTAAPAAPAADDKTKPAAQEVQVSMRLTDHCWAEVQVDGKTVFEGMLEKGKTEHWKGKETVILRAGNAGAVELTVNGKNLGKLGNKGEVVERRFTKDTKDAQAVQNTKNPNAAR